MRRLCIEKSDRGVNLQYGFLRYIMLRYYIV